MSEQLLFGVLVDEDKHYPRLNWSDFSDPQVWRPNCSCGWRGVVIFDEMKLEQLPTAVRSFAEKNGIESVLDENSIFGKSEDAVIQILHHLNYDPIKDKIYAESAFDYICEELKGYQIDKSGDTHEMFDLTYDLEKASREIAYQKERSHLWSTTGNPTKRVDAYEKSLALKLHMISEWESSNEESSISLNSEDTAS